MMSEPHTLPLGTFVEILPDEDLPCESGVRLYVVRHHRDCDGTPLYALGLKPQIGVGVEDRDVFVGGYSVDALRVIEP